MQHANLGRSSHCGSIIMMAKNWTLKVLFVLMVASSIVISLAQDVDVCVVGAGPAGVQAAYSAEAAGYTTVIFEKESWIGGKTKAVTVDGEEHIMGAAIHMSSKGNRLNGLLRKFDLPPPRKADIFFKGYFDTDGNLVRYIPPNPVLMLLQLARFIARRALLAAWLNRPDWYLADYPDDLNVLTSEEWLRKNRMSKLLPVFWIVQTSFGYGDAKDVPVVYLLKCLDASTALDLKLLLLNLVRPSRIRLVAYYKLMEAMAESLKGDVYLSTNITSVSYETTQNVISFQENGSAQEQTLSCGSTIVAFPPIAGSMGTFTPPGDDGVQLQSLVSQVQTTNYFTLLLEDREGLFGTEEGTFHSIPMDSIPDDPATNLFYYNEKPSSSSSPSLITAYYLSPSNKTDEEATSECLASFGGFNGGQSVDKNSVRDFNRWVYFPHVSPESLEAGFYENFEAMQGKSRQYYTGGLFNYDAVQESMEHAEYIIDTYF